MPTEIKFEAERLILRGFDYADRYRIGSAFEKELGRVLVERGLPTELTERQDISRLDVGNVEFGPVHPPSVIGTKIAREVYRGLNR